MPTPDHVTAQMSGGKPYEYSLLRVLQRAMDDGDVFVDVGAHVGNHAIYLALSGDITVHCFEPNGTIADVLERNIEQNRLTSRVTVYRVALGASDASGTLVLSPGNTGATRVTERDGGGDIPIRALADVYNGRVDVLKVDVEGSEVDVVEGAIPTIRRFHPLIVIESGEATTVPELEDVLREEGYRRLPINMAATPTYLYATGRHLPRIMRSRVFLAHAARMLVRSSRRSANAPRRRA